MSCTEIRDALVSYLDGELEPAERELVREHLANCGTCTAEAEELRATLGLLGAWSPREDAEPSAAHLAAEVAELRARVAELEETVRVLQAEAWARQAPSPLMAGAAGSERTLAWIA